MHHQSLPEQAYPVTLRQDIVEDFHGIQVADPYRWLEDSASPESRSWTEAQNQLTRAYLDGSPREAIHTRLKALCDYTRCSATFKLGNHYFHWRNEGLQNQPVLYWQHRFTQDPVPLLNPNAINSQGIVAVMNADPSRDGKWLAYSLSQRGSDWQEVRIRNVDSGEDLPDLLQYTKFAGIA
ncbi:MAG: S9 family peptidase, partial [Candidatus Melainabacteria bacterium HGW-Melainabacteria-1]